MSWIKSIFLSVLALFLFLGTVGVDIFSHFCEEDGIEVSYFVEDASICEEHQHDTHHQKEHESDACEEVKANHCCNTVASHVQVKLDFNEKIDLKPIILSEVSVCPIWAYETGILSELKSVTSGTDPPPIEELTRLALIQTWII